MFDIILNISLVIISIATLGTVVRVFMGPSAPDRVIALDAFGINIISITAITSVILRTTSFLSVILLIGALAFIGTVAFAKFLEKGHIIEHDRNNS